MADIAVIGIGCRFPGDAKSPTEFYQMLLKGRSGRSEIPKDRFNIDAYWHPSYDRKGTMVSRGGHFLTEDVGLFDATFFSMTEGEANAMDPQHRLLLEITYECLENAGLPMGKIAGTDMSCFVGGFTREYEIVTGNDVDNTLLYTTTGNGITMMSNRLSWFYDIRGVSLTLDTACSSSLVALSLACQDIRNSKSDCRQSLVAGSNLILIPDKMTTMNPLHFLSPDSQCFSFDDRANGYVRGEGVGVLVLKHIDDAIRDGDCIRAVIRNVECNQDGKTPGITLPSSDAQAALIRKTYETAGLDTNTTGYFEAHGTGTSAGDPLEVSAIASVFDRARTGCQTLLIGSVKPNIGHLEAGAGVAGLIKTILALESGIIPQNINFESPNPRLGLAERNLKVVTEPTPWPTTGLRRASVNSFGYGGTNAHCIVDDAYHYLASRGIFGKSRTEHSPSGQVAGRTGLALVNGHTPNIGRPLLFVLSAPEHSALSRVAASQATYLHSHISSNPGAADEILQDIAYTYGQRRSFFQWRTSIVSESSSDLAIKLDQVTKGSRAAKEPKLLFCFTGQGAQWFSMGRELLSYDVFAKSVSDADQYLLSIGSSWSALDELTASEDLSNINHPRFSQPLCTILQVALVDLLAHWGVKPNSVLGHSSGEIAAAYAFGALSAEDCWRIAFHRGRLAEEIKSIRPDLDGGMLAVGLSKAAMEIYIVNFSLAEGQVLSIACVNSPESVTMSGDNIVLDQLEQILKANKIYARKLAVLNAYHSKHMEQIAEQYRQALGTITVKTSHASVSMFSSVTGKTIDEELGADYWVKNLVSPVLFHDALQAVFHVANGGGRRRGRASVVDIILEIGPHAALSGPVKQTLQQMNKTNDVTYASVLRRKECSHRTAIATMGLLWAAGAKVIVNKVNNFSQTPQGRIPLTDLPKYPWNHGTRYWHESTLSKSLRFRHSPRTDLLGAPVGEFTLLEPTWKNYIRLAELPWISQHCVRGNDVFPAAGMICSAIEGVKQIADPAKRIKSFDLFDIVISRALIIPVADPGVEVFTRLRPRRHGAKGVSSWYEFTFSSLEESTGPDRRYTEHCSGLVTVIYEDGSDTTTDEDKAAAQFDRETYFKTSEVCERQITAGEHYSMTSKRGIVYGPVFQGLNAMKAGSGQATFEVKIQDTQSIMPANFEFPFVIHPTLLDAAIQSVYQGLTHDRTNADDNTVVPTEFRSMRVSANIPNVKGTQLVGFVNADWISPRDCRATIKVGLKNWSDTVLELEDCVFMGLGDSTSGLKRPDSTAAVRKLASKNVWKPAIDLFDQLGGDAKLILGKDLDSAASLATAEAACTQAAIILIQRALKALSPEIEATLTGHWVFYLAWLRGKYNDALAGRLNYQEEAKENWLEMTYEREEEFLEDCKQMYPADINLLYAVGVNLPEIIAGTQPPLPIMLVSDMLTKIYADGHGMSSGLRVFREWFDLMGHKKPDINILEVGAGTGSVTLPVLDILGGRNGGSTRFGSYVFTDISNGWFEKAREFLQPWAGLVKYQRLDIEQDPFAQGFEPESFDVIAANNVLHATKRLDVTLGNCYKLLKPGGKMIIGEFTWCPDHVGVIFGTLPGWWLSEDGRNGAPVINQEEWDKRLRECQFTGLDIAVAAEDSQGAKLYSTMVSTKICPTSKLSLKKAIIIEPLIGSELGAAIVKAVEDCCRAAAIESVTISLREAGFMADGNELNENSIATMCLIEAVTPVFAEPTREVFEGVCKIITKSHALFWYSCNNSRHGTSPPAACAISGLLRTATSENPSLRLYEIHLQARPIEEVHIYGDLVWRTLQTIWWADDTEEYENEISEIEDILNIPRIMDDEPLNNMLHGIGKTVEPEEQPVRQRDRPLELNMSKNGNIDGLHFVDDEEATGPLPEGFVEIEVKANAINSVDVEVASGRCPGLHLGIDVSGIVSKLGSGVQRLCIGDKVALTYQGGFRTHVRVPEHVPQTLPDHIDLELAAAIPFVYMAAYHGILELAHLAKGEKLLITQASGSLGQALVLFAKLANAEIYATAGSVEKRKYTESQLDIPPDHIFDSSSPSFMRAAMRVTNYQGFDVVLTTLRGEQLSNLCSCIAPFGRLVHYNQGGSNADTSFPLRHLASNVSFSSVNISMLLERAPQRMSHLLGNVFSLFRSKVIKPLQPTVFDYSDLKSAFVTAQSKTHIGPIVLRLTEASKGPVVPKDSHPLKIRSDATYALSGGLGGVCRALACYLADHGARHIVLLSRSTAIKGDAVRTLSYLHDLNVSVKIIACDVTNIEAVRSALDEINKEMPPVKGVVLGAMHLHDGLFENMTYEQWVDCTRPKIEGTWNMHEVMPQDVDFFVMLSSIAGISGNPGQSNYAAGNSYQDAMAHYRRSLGLKACTIDVGGVGNFGWLEDNKKVSTIAEMMSHLIINPDELFLMFKCAVTGYTSLENSCPTQLITGIGTGGMSAAHVAAGGKSNYSWLNMQGRFAYLRQLDARTISKQTPHTHGGEFTRALASATSIWEAATIVQKALAAKLATSMMIATNEIDTNLSISTYGVDSLVAAELRNWCVQEVKAVVSVFEFLNAAPISTLALHIAEKSALVPKTVERS